MFRSLSLSVAARVRLQINGREVSVPEGASVWSAMAQAGETATRLSPVTEQQRSAYCAMGVCFECLVEIDGQPNRQACLTEVRDGMCVEFQQITESSSCLPETVATASAAGVVLMDPAAANEEADHA